MSAVDDFMDHLLDLSDLLAKPEDFDVVESYLTHTLTSQTGRLKRFVTFRDMFSHFQAKFNDAKLFSKIWRPQCFWLQLWAF